MLKRAQPLILALSGKNELYMYYQWICWKYSHKVFYALGRIIRKIGVLDDKKFGCSVPGCFKRMMAEKVREKTIFLLYLSKKCVKIIQSVWNIMLMIYYNFDGENAEFLTGIRRYMRGFNFISKPTSRWLLGMHRSTLKFDVSVWDKC